MKPLYIAIALVIAVLVCLVYKQGFSFLGTVVETKKETRASGSEMLQDSPINTDFLHSSGGAQMLSKGFSFTGNVVEKSARNNARIRELANQGTDLANLNHSMGTVARKNTIGYGEIIVIE